MTVHEFQSPATLTGEWEGFEQHLEDAFILQFPPQPQEPRDLHPTHQEHQT